jgi:hypothetical protein
MILNYEGRFYSVNAGILSYKKGVCEIGSFFLGLTDSRNNLTEMLGN